MVFIHWPDVESVGDPIVLYVQDAYGAERARLGSLGKSNAFNMADSGHKLEHGWDSTTRSDQNSQFRN